MEVAMAVRWNGVFNVEPTFDRDGVQVTSGIDEEGREHPDPVPLRPAVIMSGAGSIEERVRRLVHSELMRQYLESQGAETFEEADDFSVEDDPLDPLTQYELDFDPMGRGPPAAAPRQTPAKEGEASQPGPPSGAVDKASVSEFKQEEPNVKRSESK